MVCQGVIGAFSQTRKWRKCTVHKYLFTAHETVKTRETAYFMEENWPHNKLHNMIIIIVVVIM